MKEETIKKLEYLINKDQENIKLFKEGKISEEEFDNTNNENFEFIKEVIEKEGFPYKNIASEKAYDAWFLITQHSGDLDFMKKMIPILWDADKNNVTKAHLAYFIDRINILEDKKQIYGTQFKIDNEGKIDFFDIEDIENIDERRAELDMESFDEYKTKLG